MRPQRLSAASRPLPVSANGLAVMLKAPEPGSVKTRMVPPLTPEQAARLYECLARDTFSSLADLASEGVEIYAAYLGSEKVVKPMVPDGVEMFAQRGRGLGERMYETMKSLFERGHTRCAIVGSDLPDLPAGYVRDAFALLEAGEQLVLGPADDGGYYLAAADAPYKEIFTSIKYSTPEVLGQTMAKAKKNSIRCALASPWHDIDSFDDLRLLGPDSGARESLRFVREILL